MSIKKDTLYVLNKEGTVIATFNKDDKDTIIDPIIQETQNQEATLTFQIPALSEKWKSTYKLVVENNVEKQIFDAENLYLMDDKIFSANFTDCIERERTDDNEDLITVVAYERQKLLERQYVRAWNSTTGFETIDPETGEEQEGVIGDFMVVIVSGGDKPLTNDDHVISNPVYSKGTSGYVLEALLYGTGWQLGTCDVTGIYDFETEQLSVWENIQQVQEIWGGIIVVDSLNKVIHHRDETQWLPYSGYEVKYQKNLQSSRYIGDNKVITKLCPLGEGGLNIKDVNDGSLWLTNTSYTTTELAAIENNDDIYEQDQLKRWGERKLAEMCKPRKEFTFTTALLKGVENYEYDKTYTSGSENEFDFEEVHLNDIVDVIDYDFIENKTIQLRVIEYRHYMWSNADSEIVIGDITLESTDIFKKSVQATNLINNGSLNTRQIVDYYKNGQSLGQTLKQIDQIIIDTKSELTQTDEEIKARVTQTETDVDNLNNVSQQQSRTISELAVSVNNIRSQVETIADLTKIISSLTGEIVFEEALEGDLIEIDIFPRHETGDIFLGTYVSNNTILDDELYVLDKQIVFEVFTTNKIPIKSEEYEQGAFDVYSGEKFNNKQFIRSKNFLKVDNNYSAYFSIKSSNSSYYYLMNNIIFYDKYYNFITTYYRYFNRNSITEGEILFPGDTAYIKFCFEKRDINTDERLNIAPGEIGYLMPMFEYCSTYKDDNTYSGDLPDSYIELDGIKNYNQYRFDAVKKKATNNTEFEICFKELESTNTYTSIITTNSNDFRFNNKYDGNYTTKLFQYNGNNYLWQTENEYFNVRTTLSFKNNILTITDGEHTETKEIPVATTFESTNYIILFSSGTNDTINCEFYYCKIWENDSLIKYLHPAINKNKTYNDNNELIGLENTVGIYDSIEQKFNFWGSTKFYGAGITRIKYFNIPTTDYIKTNSQKFSFDLNLYGTDISNNYGELRYMETTVEEDGETKIVPVYDMFVIKNNEAYVVRRIGLDNNDEKYILTDEETIVIGECIVPLVDGDNTLKILGNNPTIYAQYSKQNKYTDVFATKIEVSTLIEQTDNQIVLMAQEKISRSALLEELQDKFVSQIIITPQRITMRGNTLVIDSTKFKVNEDGYMTATGGNIAGWKIDDERLFKHRSGMVANDKDLGIVFYAGADSETSTDGMKFRVLNDGQVTAQLMHIECQSTTGANDGMHCYYNKKLGMVYNPWGIKFIDTNDFSGDYTLAELSRSNGGTRVGFIFDRSDGFYLYDKVNNKNLCDFSKAYTYIYNPAFLYQRSFMANNDNVFLPIATTGSDKRLKKLIKDSEIKDALSLIRKMKHKSFTWKSSGVHKKIGYIAQELEEIEPDFVEKIEQPKDVKTEYDYIYQLDTLTILATATKAIQELDEENQNLKNKVENLEKQVEKMQKMLEALLGEQE